MIWLLSIAILVLGCATPYRAASLGSIGGYSQSALAPGFFELAFSANGVTSRETVIAYWHRRAKELCDGHGYEHEGVAGVLPEARGRETGDEILVTIPTRPPVAKGYVRCATAAGEAPAARASAADVATIYVHNVSGAFATLGRPVVVLDGRELGRVGAGESAWFRAPPGEHALHVGDPLFSGRKLATARITSVPGSIVHLKHPPEDPSSGIGIADVLSGKVSGARLLEPPPLVPVGPLEARALLLRTTLVRSRDAPVVTPRGSRSPPAPARRPPRQQDLPPHS